MFHMNIKSLSKHFDELQQYIYSLTYDFSVIGISETWLKENDANLYALNGYVKSEVVENKGGEVEFPFIFIMKSHLQSGMI